MRKQSGTSMLLWCCRKQRNYNMKIIINADDCGKSTAVAGGLIFPDAKKLSAG